MVWGRTLVNQVPDTHGRISVVRPKRLASARESLHPYALGTNRGRLAHDFYGTGAEMNRRNFLETCAAIAGFAALSAYPLASSKGRRVLDAATFTALRRFAETPFGRISYVERGAGPTALFLHGLPLNGFHWRGSLERLSPYRRCIAPDFMGLGYTEVSEQQDLSPQAQTDMLAAFLNTLSIPSVDLVANDSGGTIAQLFAAQHPERVRTMLLTN